MEDTLLTKAMRGMEDGMYDAQVKTFLANKEILAQIMKSCVEEYRECSIADIVNKYIEGVPQIDTVVDREDAVPTTKGLQIQGINTEDKTSHEGTALYDIRFFAVAPNDEGKLIKLIINVEAQKSDRLPYSIPTRGIYYCGRMLSAEKNVEFVKSEYENIKKVYSIWICYSSPEHPNTMTRFKMMQDDMIGHVEIKKEDYDLLQVILIRLGKPDETEMGTILHMLDVIFSDSVKLEDKKKVLENEYGVQMTEKLDKELNYMCNISQGIREEGIQEGIQKGIQEGIQEGIQKGIQKGILSTLATLISKGRLTIAEAAETAGMSEEDFRKALANVTV